MIQKLLSIIYPKICLGCNTLLLKNEDIICTTCFYELPYTYHFTNSFNETYKKFYGLVPIEFGVSFLYFNEGGIVQKMVHNLKYKNKQKVGVYFAQLFANDLQKLVEHYVVDEIIPVPLHKKKYHVRGYNQVETFGKTLSARLGIVYNDKLLFRNKNSKTQTKKNKEERQKVENAFEARFLEHNYNKHYLLIDDVITTGSTLENCVKALLEIPNAKVSIATMAYTLS
ncbi:ComF family protein [Flavobacterium sp.]|uniref:ComF family protein n=1 Tax=Flavobacterium sp. TaxID=239 RepID=UPI003528E730